MKIKSVPLTLTDGVERHLLYDVNAFIDLGKALDVNLLTKEGWGAMVGKLETVEGEEVFVQAPPTYEKVRAIVWAGLLHEDEKITLRQVGALLDPADLAPVVQAYTEAWTIQDASEPAKDAAAPLAAAASSAKPS